MKRTTSFLLVILFVCILFAGCTTEKQFRDDTTPDALIENAERKLTFEDGVLPVVLSEAALKLSPGLSGAIALSDRQIIKDTAGESCDEYGIIHLTDRQNATAAVDGVKEYLAYKANLAVKSNYPDCDKLNDAEVRVFGGYIVFAAMTEENKTAFFSEIEQLLLEV